MADDDGWDDLARQVRARRDQLGLKQEDVAEAGGPSVATLRAIERNAREGYRSSTLLDLDEVLQWRGGTSEAIAAGTADPDPTTWIRTTTIRPNGRPSSNVVGVPTVEMHEPDGQPPYALIEHTPRRAAEDRLREVREARGWSAGQLATYCRTLGASDMTAGKIRDIEGHRRGVLDVNDLVLLCYALDVALVNVMAPTSARGDTDEHRISTTPDHLLRVPWYRAWIRGEWAPSDVDPAVYFHEVPDDDWHPETPDDETIAERSGAVRGHREMVATVQPTRAHPDFMDETTKAWADGEEDRPRPRAEGTGGQRWTVRRNGRHVVVSAPTEAEAVAQAKKVRRANAREHIFIESLENEKRREFRVRGVDRD